MLVGGLLALAATAAAVVWLTPWQPLNGPAQPVTPEVARDFTAAQVSRAGAFRTQLGPWPYLALALRLATPWAGYLVLSRRPGRPGRALLAVVLTAGAVVLAQLLVGLPFDVHAELVLRRFGLSTQTWAGWTRDQLVGLAMTGAVTEVVLLLVLWLVRRQPRRWPWLLAILAAAGTVVASAIYPLVVERAYNQFTELAPSPLTQRIEALARADGLGRVRVVQADASTRTTGENAHVSGIGSTRWVVLDDTLLARGDPAAVTAVVAHEFGHVVHDDVVRGTVIGALGASTAVLLLAAASLSPRGRASFSLTSDRQAGRGRLAAATCLLVAIGTTGPLLVAPVTNLVSRRVEASADVHALDLTRDPAAFIRMQQALATTNLSRLEPTWWQTALFATHPSPPWRIALARAWQRSPRTTPPPAPR